VLDPVHFDELFEAAVEPFKDKARLAAFHQLGHHVLIVFDGIEYFHTLLSATLVLPGPNKVVPPPPRRAQDANKKDGSESRAARR